jgi:hypothetical protein
MATKYSALPEPTPRRLNKAERVFWRQAFLGAEIPVLLKGNGRRISAAGAAHLAADYADAALIEFRRRLR